MFFAALAIAAAVLSFTEAKICTNITIPVNINARNGVFNIPEPTSPPDVSSFLSRYFRQGGNYSHQVLQGYNTTVGLYDISATYCKPDDSSAPNATTVQFLTHGIGFDKSYWDLSYNNFNYSYTNVAVDQYGYSTLAIDRFGIGSSIADPIQTVQVPAEISVMQQITTMLRAGTIPGLDSGKPSKIVHIGHSFGSILTLGLAAAYPTISDGLILTGFSTNETWNTQTFIGFNLKIAALNEPFRFGGASLAHLNSTLSTYGLLDLPAGLQLSMPEPARNLLYGYLVWSDIGVSQFSFLASPYFDPAFLPILEATKQTVTIGELLTESGAVPAAGAPKFTGPVQVLTGNEDAIFCGGNCTNTGNPLLASVPATVKAAFPASRRFEAYIHPNCGHGINAHYNATAAYRVMQEFLRGSGL